MTYPQLIARDLLAAMTDDEAAAFVTEARTPRNDPPDPTTEFVRRLFAPDAPDEPPGYAAREGNIPKTQPADEQAMREFVRNLLDTPEN